MSEQHDEEYHGDVELPYVKSDFGKLIGYIEDGDKAVINSLIVRASKSFNIYKAVNQFFKERERVGNENTPAVYEFPSWLVNQGFIADLVTDMAGAAITEEFVSLPHFNVVPYYPSYKDILWNARILKDATRLYTPEDIFHLSLYRGMLIDGFDVEAIVLTRNHDSILSLALHLKDSHDKRVSDALMVIENSEE